MVSNGVLGFWRSCSLTFSGMAPAMKMDGHAMLAWPTLHVAWVTAYRKGMWISREVKIAFQSGSQP
jgi:hypothetical protein